MAGPRIPRLHLHPTSLSLIRRRTMTRRADAALLGAIAMLLGAQVNASVVTTSNPNVATDIGARIRWGGTGFEASIFDTSPALNQNPTLNPVGAPVWGVGNAYKFQVSFDSATGVLGLGVDFDRDNNFETGESIVRSVFNSPPQTSYLGYGFEYLSISGNEGGSTARSTVANLVINGNSQSSISPNGTFSETFFKDSSGKPLTSILITGDLTFSTPGTSQERPSWNFNFKGPEVPSPVPLPAAAWLFGSALMGIAGIGYRRQSKQV